MGLTGDVKILWVCPWLSKFYVFARGCQNTMSLTGAANILYVCRCLSVYALRRRWVVFFRLFWCALFCLPTLTPTPTSTSTTECRSPNAGQRGVYSTDECSSPFSSNSALILAQAIAVQAVHASCKDFFFVWERKKKRNLPS